MSMWLTRRIDGTAPVLLKSASRHVQRRMLTRDGRRLVLGIESSCDDSAASLVSAPPTYPAANTVKGAAEEPIIHTSIVLKQDHGATKGIEPLKAAQGHSQNLPVAIAKALQEGEAQGILHSAAQPREIDAIAVTQGPGMNSCLFAGMTQAKLLATLWDVPLLYVHHMVAHTLTPLMTSTGKHGPPPQFPFLVFLLSGGHTQAVLCKSLTQFHILATSNDNSIGSAFDKVARDLDIPVDWSRTSPGAALEKFAAPYIANEFPMPESFVGKPEFSFSGLYVTVQRLCKNHLPQLVNDKNKHEAARRAIAFAFQRSAFGQIQDKLRMALKPGLPPKSRLMRAHVRATDVHDVVVSGGVASNEALRFALHGTLRKIGRDHDVRMHFPPIALCTDNAAMIAHAGLLRWNTTRDLSANPRAQWSVEDYP